MSTATLSPPAPRIVPLTPYLFSVEEYNQMIEMRLFDGKGRFELIEGQVVQQMVPNPPYDNCLDNVNIRLNHLISTGWRVRVQSGITLSGSVPLPDICVARGDDRTYATRRPEPADIALFVEVADTTLDSDRTAKGEMYARDGIVEYWIVNIPDRQVEVYTQPSGPTANPTYSHVQVYQAHSTVPLVLAGVALGSIAVNDIIM